MKPRIPRRRPLGPAEPAPVTEQWIKDWQLPKDLPSSLLHRLTEPGLLTDRIQREAGQAPVLNLLSLYWSVLTTAQRARLNVEGSRCFVREIELVTATRRWVFAQTLIPESKRSLLAWITALGSRPLGEALASLSKVVHGTLEYCQLSQAHPLAQSALHGHEAVEHPLWARRRWIAIAGQRMLVQEVLLPEIT